MKSFIWCSDKNTLTIVSSQKNRILVKLYFIFLSIFLLSTRCQLSWPLCFYWFFFTSLPFALSLFQTIRKCRDRHSQIYSNESLSHWILWWNEWVCLRPTVRQVWQTVKDPWSVDLSWFEAHGRDLAAGKVEDEWRTVTDEVSSGQKK